MKVYCSNCKYLKSFKTLVWGDPRTEYACESPNNKKNIDNWFSPDYKCYSPREKNKNNDCKWYEKKCKT